jgi:hypothetical protein
VTIWAADRTVRNARMAPSRVAEASPQAGVITTCAATGGSRPRSRSGAEHPSGYLIRARVE